MEEKTKEKWRAKKRKEKLIEVAVGIWFSLNELDVKVRHGSKQLIAK